MLNKTIEAKRLEGILRGITDPALIMKKIKDHKKTVYKDQIMRKHKAHKRNMEA